MLQKKIKEDEIILALCTLKCGFCEKNIDKQNIKSHI